MEYSELFLWLAHGARQLISTNLFYDYVYSFIFLVELPEISLKTFWKLCLLYCIYLHNFILDDDCIIAFIWSLLSYFRINWNSSVICSEIYVMILNLLIVLLSQKPSYSLAKLRIILIILCAFHNQMNYCVSMVNSWISSTNFLVLKILVIILRFSKSVPETLKNSLYTKVN